MASLHFHSFWSSAGERFRRAESSRPVSGRNPGSPRGGRVSRSSRICLAGEMMIRMAASFWGIDPYKTGVCFIIIFSWEKTRKKVLDLDGASTGTIGPEEGF